MIPTRFELCLKRIKLIWVPKLLFFISLGFLLRDLYASKRFGLYFWRRPIQQWFLGASSSFGLKNCLQYKVSCKFYLSFWSGLGAYSYESLSIPLLPLTDLKKKKMVRGKKMLVSSSTHRNPWIWMFKHLKENKNWWHWLAFGQSCLHFNPPILIKTTRMDPRKRPSSGFPWMGLLLFHQLFSFLLERNQRHLSLLNLTTNFWRP